MVFPLATVLTTAPGLISAAAEIIRAIRDRKNQSQQPQPDMERLNDMATLIEQQALVIEELAINNRNMALAVRNNRILSSVAAIISIGAMIITLVY